MTVSVGDMGPQEGIDVGPLSRLPSRDEKSSFGMYKFS